MYSVTILPHFRKQLKKLVKKYPSLTDHLIEALEDFEMSHGNSLGNNLYKIRISPKELKKGKSKSLRSIILLINENSQIIPVTIYSKSDISNISNKELDSHLEMILFELSQ